MVGDPCDTSISINFVKNLAQGVGCESKLGIVLWGEQRTHVLALVQSAL
jgi:hypothetical protein